MDEYTVGPFPVTREYESGLFDGLTKVTSWVPVSEEFAADALFARETVSAALGTAVRRMLYPWEFPDRPRIPHVDLFPRLTAVAARVDGFRTRAADAWDVLRHGLPDHDEWA